MIAGPPKLPALCDSCGNRVPFRRISNNQYRLLLDDYYLRYFSDELRMLEKVADFYRRNPKTASRILPHFEQVLASKDPKVMQQLADGVAFDEIELPPEAELQLESPAPTDAEVVKYLKHHSFNLEGRLSFVKERLSELGITCRPVTCARCQRGQLHLKGGTF